MRLSRVRETEAGPPQSNDKIESFHRTLADSGAFKPFYTSECQRRSAMPAWIHQYNHHRPYTAVGEVPPISGLTNLADQYSWRGRERGTRWWGATDWGAGSGLTSCRAFGCAWVRTGRTMRREP
jgi:hypothetical protein